MSNTRVANPDDANRDQALEAIIADYIRCCETGNPTDRRAILDGHPEFADDLRQFFAQHDHMNQLVEPIREFADDQLQSVGPGQQISYVGNYELLEEIARGGMGIVYKACQSMPRRFVAVKLILKGRLATDEDVKRLKAEAQAAGGLQHPNIVAIHEVGEHEGWHYFSMDYVSGRDLSAVLREKVLSPRQAAAYVRQMAEAIHYAHQQGILHRDLKPSNVMIDNDDQVRITDFGLAMRVDDDSKLTRTGQILGSPCYMPPEQAQGKRSLIGPGSDVYAMGAVLYECLTGRPPFRADSFAETIQQVAHVDAPSPRLLNPAVPLDLETICLKCLQKESNERYLTAQQLEDDLSRYLRGEPILARPISVPARVWRWCRRQPVVASLSAATVLSLVGVAVVSTLGYLREADLRQSADQSAIRAKTGEEAATTAVAANERTIALLKNEQRLTNQLNTTVSDLEQKRAGLDREIARVEHDLKNLERDLTDNLIQLARNDWAAGNVVRADEHLEKCPKHLRSTEWHRLKRLWLPEVRKFNGHSRVAFSPDGTLLAMAGSVNTIEIWEVANHRLLHSLAGHTEKISAIAFSGDGKLLASGSHDRTVRLWTLPDGKLERTLAAHSHPVSDVAFNPDGRQLASASFNQVRVQRSNGEVIIWNRQTFQEEYRLQGFGRVAFSPDGNSIAIRTTLPDKKKAVETPVVQIWNIESLRRATCEPFLTIPVTDDELVPAVFSTDGELFAVVGVPKDLSRKTASLEIWNLRRKTMQQQLAVDFQVHSLAFSPDTKRLACGGRDGFSEAVSTTFKVVTFNLITGERDRVFPWYQRTVTDVAFDRDGRCLATATSESVKIWDVTSPSDPTRAILASIAEYKVRPGDWPQWGGSTSRINTPEGKNIPVDWDVGAPLSGSMSEEGKILGTVSKTGQIPKGSRNIKWAAQLGSTTYGNPVVANGRVFVGTNNSSGYLKRYPPKIDLGVLLCFEEATGNFLWQHSNPKLPTGRVHDWPQQGVCSTPVIDGDRLWYVTNRCEVVCLDTEGFHDGKDDGLIDGDWSELFLVPSLLHGMIPSESARVEFSDFPTHLQVAFSEHELNLPKRMSILQGYQSWTIHEYRDEQTKSGLRRLEDGPLLYRMQVVGDQLRVSAAVSDAQGELPKELFSVSNHLLPNIGTPQIVFALKEKLSKNGITLSPETDPITEKPGKIWSFSAVMNGKEERFQVRDVGAWLSIRKWLTPDLEDADVVWRFDMMKQLGVSPHNMSTCSMITVDGMLFVCTSNGVDEGHINLPAPNAPSFIAMDRITGQVLWTDNSPGMNILHAQWASPSYGVFEGQPQVIFPGGDGWVYSFDPKGDGQGGSRLLWKFDANPKESIYTLGGRSTRNQIISFPAIYDGLVYIVVGEDPEHGEGQGHLWCIDPVKRTDGADVSAELAVNADGNIIPHRRLQAVIVKLGERAVPNPNSAVRWHFGSEDRNGNGKIEFQEKFHRSLSIPVIKDDILYIADYAGLFHCLNAKTGKFYWNFDLYTNCWGSALLVDGHVYICDEDGDVTVFRHSADPQVAMNTLEPNIGKYGRFVPFNRPRDVEGATHFDKNAWPNFCSMNSAIYMTPIVANNVLYIATRNTLYAIEASSTDRDGHIGEKPIEPLTGPIPIQFLQRPHVNIATMATFSPDGDIVASTSEDNTAVLWNWRERKALHVLKGHTKEVVHAAFSLDGKILATCGRDSKAILWDVGSGIQRTVVDDHTGSVNAALYSPDGTTLITASSDRSVKIREIDGRIRYSLEGHQQEVMALAISTDGKTLISAGGIWSTPGQNGEVKAWDLETHTLRWSSSGEFGVILGVALSPDGTQLAGACLDGTVRLWNVLTGETVSILQANNQRVLCVDYEPVSQRLISSGRDGLMYAWDLSNLQSKLIPSQDNFLVQKFSFSVEKKLMVTAGSDGIITVWQLPEAGVK